ncbi:MAG: S8 family serine peptidase, partial [Chloroflexi bacterium]|nr:S8 family serine peptidase [Chloroflexota bacterium]
MTIFLSLGVAPVAEAQLAAPAATTSSDRLVVKFKSSTSVPERSAAINAAGGREVQQLSQVRSHVVQVTASQRAAILARYARDPRVESIALAVRLGIAQVVTTVPTATVPTATATATRPAATPSAPTATQTALRPTSIPSPAAIPSPTLRAPSTATATTSPTLVLRTATATSTATRAATATAVTVSPPNDPLFSQQWALTQIGWSDVWRTAPISGVATIAVLDTGVDASHPDLAGRVLAGQSFTGGNAGTDSNGHGTAMAGIAAADTDNGQGIAGIAYTAANILPVQVLGADGSGYDSDVAAGVLWAADQGAGVILLAMSSSSYSAVLADAVNYAWQKGAIVVAATGNDGGTEATYPAGLPNVLGAAATDQSGSVSSFSNTRDVAVAAPGVNISSLAPGGGYTQVTGTSAAAAIVAG